MARVLCPSADNPIIPVTKKTKHERLALLLLMIGDVGGAFGMAYVFGFYQGAVYLTNIWIDYLGYATMNFCFVLLMSFFGGS